MHCPQFPLSSLADPTRCPRQRRRRSRPHLSHFFSANVDCAACCASCANNSSICFNFLLSFFSRFLVLFVCFVCLPNVLLCFVFCFGFCCCCCFVFFFGHFVIYSTRFFSFQSALAAGFSFGKLFSGSPDKNTHTIYQLDLEFSAFFLFCVFLFFFSLLLLLFRFFVVVFRSLLSHLSSFISIENV